MTIAATTTTPSAPAPKATQASFVFSGKPGMAFGLVGEGFGEEGTLTISGRAIPTVKWTDTNIRGELPKNLPAGPIIVTSGDVVQTSFFKG